MEILLTFVAALATVVVTIIKVIEFWRTPKPKREPEKFTPTSLTIIGAPMHRGSDLYGKEHRGSDR